jgi:hypothetical protein
MGALQHGELLQRLSKNIFSEKSPAKAGAAAAETGVKSGYCSRVLQGFED